MENTLEQPVACTRPSLFDDLDALVRSRRAPIRFTRDPVPREVVDNALAIAAQADARDDIPRCRFLVLAEPGQRQRLVRAASLDHGIGEAPVLVVAFTQGRIAANRDEDAASVSSPLRRQGHQVMIAFTFLLLAVEAQGWDAAPVARFDSAAIPRAFDLPDDAEVAALIAIGRAAGTRPASRAPVRVSEIAFRERYGVPLIPFNESES
ncbi:MAG TPA: nitroreductase family protein [Opitutus sp.]|nr:nitroreductase family protein [Opitutus sp.]